MIVSAGFAGMRTFLASPAAAKTSGGIAGASPYGDLIRDPMGILDLPKGFSYKILGRTGDIMDDGLRLPGRPDGMAAFPGKDGRVILVRNHENLSGWSFDGPFGTQNELLDKVAPENLYDYGKGVRPAPGGTTTLVYNPATEALERQYLSLGGTVRNCAGGPTPWGSWVSCEETVERAGDYTEKDHGYNFEVPAREEIGLVDPVPLKAMGRFNHEAIAVDPKSGIVYQSEDRGDGLFYRFIPDVPGKLAEGGRLQALVVRGSKGYDTRNWAFIQSKMPVGQRFAVEWIDMDEIDSPKDDLRYRGHVAGAARFARGEGMWYGNDEIYLACTNGGAKLAGQVFRYIPSPVEGTAAEASQPGELELFLEPNDTELLESCDNLTVAPWGHLVIVEDGNDTDHIRGVTPNGEIYTIARNVYNDSEMAGPCFAPDGKTLFLNIQVPGMTLAVVGPWGSAA